MGIWRNIGKIVSLSCEIIYLEMKWYVGSWSPTKKSNTPHKEDNTLSSNTELSEQEESIERSKVMLHQYEYEQVEWSENPFPRHSKIK